MNGLDRLKHQTNAPLALLVMHLPANYCTGGSGNECKRQCTNETTIRQRIALHPIFHPLHDINFILTSRGTADLLPEKA